MSLHELLNDPDFTDQVGYSKEKYRSDDVIMEEESPGDDVFLVLSGEVHVRTDLGKDIDHELASGLAKLEKDDVFGELAIFDDEPRSAKVIAATDCEIARINGMKLLEFMDANPDKGYFVMRDFFINLIFNLRQNNLRIKTIMQLYLNGCKEESSKN